MMRARTSLATVLAVSSAAVLLAPRAHARRMVIHDEDRLPPSFALDGALVLDADSGDLVKVDGKGDAIARVAIGPEAAQLVVDRAARTAFV
ncbi:MAG: hypothetical protein K8M05_41240, partial [Deltaproteobacteria bacterium]|nr:hypothetical protein [Kofleriaceae bacterium]